MSNQIELAIEIVKNRFTPYKVITENDNSFKIYCTRDKILTVSFKNNIYVVRESNNDGCKGGTLTTFSIVGLLDGLSAMGLVLKD